MIPINKAIVILLDIGSRYVYESDIIRRHEILLFVCIQVVYTKFLGF